MRVFQVRRGNDRVDGRLMFVEISSDIQCTLLLSRGMWVFTEENAPYVYGWEL